MSQGHFGAKLGPAPGHQARALGFPLLQLPRLGSPKGDRMRFSAVSLECQPRTLPPRVVMLSLEINKDRMRSPGLTDFLVGLVQVCWEAVNHSGLCKDQQMLGVL